MCWGLNTALWCYGLQGPSQCCILMCHIPQGPLPLLHSEVSWCPECFCYSHRGLQSLGFPVLQPGVLGSPHCAPGLLLWFPYCTLGCSAHNCSLEGPQPPPWISSCTTIPRSLHASLSVTAHDALLKVPLCTSAQCSHCCTPVPQDVTVPYTAHWGLLSL